MRNAVKRYSTRLRLSVFRSCRHIYAQVIDDETGRTLADKELRDQMPYGGNRQAAEVVGTTVARRALEAGVKQVAFDRGDYRYHGRVAALADAARDAGLDLGPKKTEPEAQPAKVESKPKKSKKAKSKA